jgi:hypothetical protein
MGSQTSSRRPQAEHYPTGAEYRWARHLWRRFHGGSLLATLALAVVFGALTGSLAGLLALLAFAIVVHAIARSRP